jgi:hypothetical protein
VLTASYHGFTNAFTLVTGSFGVKWNNGAITFTLAFAGWSLVAG